MSRGINNLVGMRFGRLVVQSLKGTSRGKSYWNCICDCGNVVTVAGHSLVSQNKQSNTRSCGCGHKGSQVIDLIGRRFGNLTVTKLNRIVDGKSYWICKCDCGHDSEVVSHSLTDGSTSSCGCKIAFWLSHDTSLTPNMIPIEMIQLQAVRNKINKYIKSH